MNMWPLPLPSEPRTSFAVSLLPDAAHHAEQLVLQGPVSEQGTESRRYPKVALHPWLCCTDGKPRRAGWTSAVLNMEHASAEFEMFFSITAPTLQQTVCTACSFAVTLWTATSHETMECPRHDRIAWPLRFCFCACGRPWCSERPG